MNITAAVATELFVGSESAPLQVVRVTFTHAGDGPSRPAEVVVRGPGVHTPVPAEVAPVPPGAAHTVEVGVAIDHASPGEVRTAEVVLHDGATTRAHPFPLVVAQTGWTMFMVSHFHYDPVWWNTQSAYTDEWRPTASARPWELSFQANGLELVLAHLEIARRDPDYRFVLAELDYLKPFWDTHPEERSYVRSLLEEGRLELVGGTYNEANTNLVSAENTIRNAIYGIGYQRDVVGGAPATAWQLDVFGHDPQFPGLMAAAGLTSASFARGPFHEWGPNWWQGPHADLRWRHGVDGARAMSFTTEFEWVAPSGAGLLTSYMANHYSAGWWLDTAVTLEEAEAEAERLFRELAEVATTRNVLLPVGTDYSPPNRWVTSIHRDWNQRYVWPRFVCATPAAFFAAVRADLERAGVAAPVQTRDMNPIYTGKDVSFIDTKQAHRLAESTLLGAEQVATAAALLGGRYPHEALDKAWRQLVFNAHHDGITGAESDQVYLDLLGGWREAHDLAEDVRTRSLRHLAGHVDTNGDGDAVLVFNPASSERCDVVTIDLRDVDARTVLAPDGTPVPVVDDGVAADGRRRLRFLASDVPPNGYRTYRLVQTDDPPSPWRPVPGSTASNERFEVEVDPDRGGHVSRLTDRRVGAELLRPGGLAGELLAYGEYPDHPHFAEGPWHLCPDGSVERSGRQRAHVQKGSSALGERLVVEGELAGCRYTQVVTLWVGGDRIDVTTHLDGWAGNDTLFRLRVDADVEGGMPVFEVADAVVGRGFGFPDVDVAAVPYTLDNPCNTWFGVGSTARVRVGDRAARAISTAEVVVPAGEEGTTTTRDVVVALARAGVTATVSTPDAPRYGRLAVDSNLPDVRIVLGGPERNPFAGRVLDVASDGYRTEYERQHLAGPSVLLWIPADRPLRDVWRPTADLRGLRDLPVLIVEGDTIDALVADLDDAIIDVDQPDHLDGTTGRVAQRGMALLNRGTPGSCVDVDGSLYTSLLRSSSGWPSGVWIDPPRRTTPDGGNFQFQRWSHTFDHAIVPYRGDWRDAGIPAAGAAFDHPLVAVVAEASGGDLPPRAALVEVDDPAVAVTAVKPSGDPLARLDPRTPDPGDGVTVRLRETTGRRRRARLSSLWPIVDAARTGVLEQDPVPLPVDDGGVTVDLEGYAVVTVRLRLDVPASTSGDVELGRRTEVAQPVHARYWRHNRGAAPLGYQPVAITVPSPSLAGRGPFTVPVVVASSCPDVTEGRVELRVPDGWRADPPERLFRLAPDGHLRFDTTIDAPTGAVAGRYLVAASFEDAAGQRYEDTVTIDLADDASRVVDEELAVDLGSEEVVIEAGAAATLELHLGNRTGSALHGEIQLLSPVETWPLVTDWTRGFSVGADQKVTVAFDVEAPVHARPGRWWILAKVMYAGRRRYTASIPFEVRAGAPDGSGD